MLLILFHVFSSDCKAQSLEEALTDPAVKDALQTGIYLANGEAISRAQTIKKWTVLKRDLSLMSGELGPTMKVKRHVVAKVHKAEIDKMYA